MWLYHLAATGVLTALLVQLALNLRALPRLAPPRSGAPRPAGRARPAVSVLIPARNEAAGIARALDAWRGELAPGVELLVLDDESTDGTGARARRALAGVPAARVLTGVPLPAGWAGKAFACHQLAAAARGSVLVFADADVEPQSGALAALLAELGDRPGGAAGVTVLPRHTAASWLGRQLAPTQAWALATFHPLWLARRRPAAMLAVANGQLLAVRRAAYRAAGGHEAVRGSLAEDTELARRLAACGLRLAVVDGSPLVTCAAPETLAETWRTNRKNLHAILFRSPALAAAAPLALAALWVVPWILLATGLGGDGPARAASALEALLGLAARVIVARRFGHRPADAWTHPWLVLVLAAMIPAAAWVARRGRIRWRDRVYAWGARAS